MIEESTKDVPGRMKRPDNTYGWSGYSDGELRRERAERNALYVSDTFTAIFFAVVILAGAFCWSM